jgi:hypothetical protein
VGLSVYPHFQYMSRPSDGLKAPRAVTQYNMVMSPVGLGTKNHCAGEGQQQFTVLDCVHPYLC